MALSSLVTKALLAILGIRLLQRIYKFRGVIKDCDGVPGYRLFVSGLIGGLFPKLPYLSLGSHWIMEHNYQDCERFGFDAFTMASFLPLRSRVYVADAKMAKEVTAQRTRFVKPLEYYKALSWYGDNLVTLEGGDWSRHRKIVAPAFTERNVALVCDVTTNAVHDLMLERTWTDAAELTKAIAIAVITGANFGFGREEVNAVLPGHTMSFSNALHIVSTNAYLRIVLRGPLWKAAGRGWMGKRLQGVHCAFSELQSYMSEKVEERRSLSHELLDCQSDLLSNLVKASDSENEKTLTDQELIGNIFIFLIAGHETTAHTLAFTLGLLAVHQEKQKLVVNHIRDVLPDGRAPRYEDLPSLNLVLGSFFEALRLYPAVVAIPKRAAQDTILSFESSANAQDARQRQMVIRKGTDVVINSPAILRNPKYWPDPEEYRPERFTDPEWPRDAFIPFSAGPRSCIGRRFAETEAVVALTRLLQMYHVDVNWDILGRIEGESEWATRNRLLKFVNILTLTPVQVPLLFTPRAK